MKYQKAETEGKSLVEAMTEREAAAKKNWKKRSVRPSNVAGIPCISSILTRGACVASGAAAAGGGASTGWTDALLTLICLPSFQ